jgi:hypothetical protein
MVAEQLRQILGVSVSDSPLEVSWVEFCFFGFVCLGFSCGSLSVFFFSFTGHFNFLFFNNGLGKLLPLLIFKRGWFHSVLKPDY